MNVKTEKEKRGLDMAGRRVLNESVILSY